MLVVFILLVIWCVLYSVDQRNVFFSFHEYIYAFFISLLAHCLGSVLTVQLFWGTPPPLCAVACCSFGQTSLYFDIMLFFRVCFAVSLRVVFVVVLLGRPPSALLFCCVVAALGGAPSVSLFCCCRCCCWCCSVLTLKQSIFSTGRKRSRVTKFFFDGSRRWNMTSVESAEPIARLKKLQARTNRSQYDVRLSLWPWAVQCRAMWYYTRKPCRAGSCLICISAVTLPTTFP